MTSDVREQLVDAARLEMDGDFQAGRRAEARLAADATAADLARFRDARDAAAGIPEAATWPEIVFVLLLGRAPDTRAELINFWDVVLDAEVGRIHNECNRLVSPVLRGKAAKSWYRAAAYRR